MNISGATLQRNLINVRSMEKPSVPAMISLDMEESTQGKSPMNVKHALSALSHALSSVSRYTLEGSAVSVPSVAKPAFIQNAGLFSIFVSTLVRNLISVVSAIKALVAGHAL